MLTFYERRKYVLTTVAGFPERLTGVIFDPAGSHDFLCLFKDFRRNNGPFRAVMLKLLFYRNVDLFTCKEILNLVFVIDKCTPVNGIHKNSAYSPGVPVIAILGLVPIAVQCEADGTAAQALFVV